MRTQVLDHGFVELVEHWGSDERIIESARVTLRSATGAQWEIRQYSNAIGEIVASRFGRTWDLFCHATKEAAA